MAGRLAVISRHVVLLSFAQPTYAVILVSDDRFTMVIPQPTERLVADLMQEFQDWNPIDCEHFYVSPGMIDANIRRSEEWEDLAHMTQAAVSGGVTLCVEERSDSTSASSGPLFCDLGVTVVLSQDTTSDCLRGAMAVKGYLTSPGYQIHAAGDLQQFLATAHASGLPVIIDSAYVDKKTMGYSSPCRELPLSVRISGEVHANTEVLGAALLADSASSSSEDDEEVKEIKRVYTEPKKTEGEENNFIVTEVRKRERLKTYNTEAASPELPTIYTALSQKIQESASCTAFLSQAEMMHYNGIGCTSYNAESVLLARTTSLDSKRKPPRPARIATAKAQSPPDTVYLLQLAQYPMTMETKGVEMVLSAVAEVPGPVHFCNLGSASAINLVRHAKNEGKEVTCETCPHFLHFTDAAIGNGDTRLKNFPPIRNSVNCNFLWELLKMNVIDTIASQHVPIAEPYKCRPYFSKAVSGINGLGFSLQVLWTILKKPFTDLSKFEHYLVRLAKWTAANPAKILGLRDRGAIEAGCFADFFIWDPFQSEVARTTCSKQQHQCPYLGAELCGRIHQVFVRGRLAYRDGEFYAVGRHTAA